MGRGAYAMQPDTMYLGGSADFDESTGRYRSGYVPPNRGMGGGMGAGLGNLVTGGMGGGMGIAKPQPGSMFNDVYTGMVQQPLNNMGGGMGAGLPFGPGTVDPRTRVGPQYDPTSMPFPANYYSNRGNSSMRDDIARRALMLRDQNAAARKGQDLGNYNMQDMVFYNANRRR